MKDKKNIYINLELHQKLKEYVVKAKITIQEFVEKIIMEALPNE